MKKLCGLIMLKGEKNKKQGKNNERYNYKK